MKVSITTTILALLLTFSVLTEASGKKNQIIVTNPEFFKSFIQDDSFYNKFLKETSSKKRMVANAKIDVPAIENAFSDDFKQLRNQLLNIKAENDSQGLKAVAQLDQIISEWTSAEKAKTLSHQAQFLVFQLRNLKQFKSFIFRAREYLGSYSPLRATVISILRSQISIISSFAPSNENNLWQVVFNYVTLPQSDMGYEINSDIDFYNFLTQLTQSSAVIANDMTAWVQKNQTVWWDNKLYFSFADFTSEKDRYIKLGAAEQYALLSLVYLNLSGLYSTTAYSLDGLQELLRSYGSRFGIQDNSTGGNGMLKNPLSKPDAGFFDAIDGVSAQERVTILSKLSRIFILVSDGKIRMSNSYSYLKSAARLARISWEETKKLPENTDSLFDPRAVAPFNRLIGTSFDNVDKLFSDGEIGSSLIMGEVVRINFSELFNNPPKKLSELYPRKFDEGPKTLDVKIKGQTVKYRNYKKGMAKSWDYKVYKKYLPDLKSTDGEYTDEIPKYGRVIAQTWGLGGFSFLALTIAF